MRLRRVASLHLQRSSQQRFHDLLAKHDTGRHRTQTLWRGFVTARNSLSLNQSLAAQFFEIVSGLARSILGLALPALCANLEHVRFDERGRETGRRSAAVPAPRQAG